MAATDIPAKRAAIGDGVTGFLCRDEAQMAETVNTLPAHGGLRAKMGAARMAQNFGSLYRRLAGAEHAAG